MSREFCEQLRRMRTGEKILRMNFQPPRLRTGGHHFHNVRKPEADAGRLRHFGQRESSRFHGGHSAVSPYLGVLLPPTIRSQ